MFKVKLWTYFKVSSSIFKGGLPLILLGPLFNTLSHMLMNIDVIDVNEC